MSREREGEAGMREESEAEGGMRDAREICKGALAEEEEAAWLDEEEESSSVSPGCFSLHKLRFSSLST